MSIKKIMISSRVGMNKGHLTFIIPMSSYISLKVGSLNRAVVNHVFENALPCTSHVSTRDSYTFMFWNTHPPHTYKQQLFPTCLKNISVKYSHIWSNVGPCQLYLWKYTYLNLLNYTKIESLKYKEGMHNYRSWKIHIRARKWHEPWAWVK